MKRLAIAAALLALLAGCGPKQPQAASAAGASPQAVLAAPTGGPADAASCGLRVERPWVERAGQRYTLAAASEGAICDIAVATLTIRDTSGAQLHAWSGAARDLFGLKDATDPASMTEALKDWVDPAHTLYPTSDKLPAWEETAGQTQSAEFPFHPMDGETKATWDAMRARRGDVFCFVQGSESQACVMLEDGRVRNIGVQQFPG
jgi:hypothetical protein